MDTAQVQTVKRFLRPGLQRRLDKTHCAHELFHVARMGHEFCQEGSACRGVTHLRKHHFTPVHRLQPCRPLSTDMHIDEHALASVPLRLARGTRDQPCGS
jgi:hypothetical protein